MAVLARQIPHRPAAEVQMKLNISATLVEISDTCTAHLDGKFLVVKAPSGPESNSPDPANPDTGHMTGELLESPPTEKRDDVVTFVILLKSAEPVDKNTPDQPETISRIEASIIEGIAAGSSSAQMAARLYMSRQGIEYHVSGMLRKFQAANRSALVSRAYCCGVLSPADWPPRVPLDRIK